MIKLIHGDALEEMEKISDNSIDLVLTDPPYGSTQISWDVIIPIDKMWEQLNRIITDKGIICLFSNQPYTFF